MAQREMVAVGLSRTVVSSGRRATPVDDKPSTVNGRKTGDGAGACIGAAFGSPFPPAVYIGHPGWKDAGGRTSYSLASGVAIGILCFADLFGVLNAFLPVLAIVPILLYIALLIGAGLRTLGEGGCCPARAPRSPSTRRISSPGTDRRRPDPWSS